MLSERLRVRQRAAGGFRGINGPGPGGPDPGRGGPTTTVGRPVTGNGTWAFRSATGKSPRSRGQSELRRESHATSACTDRARSLNVAAGRSSPTCLPGKSSAGKLTETRKYAGDVPCRVLKICSGRTESAGAKGCGDGAGRSLRACTADGARDATRYGSGDAHVAGGHAGLRLIKVLDEAATGARLVRSDGDRNSTAMVSSRHSPVPNQNPRRRRLHARLPAARPGSTGTSPTACPALAARRHSLRESAYPARRQPVTPGGWSP